MHYPAPQTPKSYPGNVDVVSVAPSYSSWGTLPTPPPSLGPRKYTGSPLPRPDYPPLVHPLLQPPGHLLRYDIRHHPPPIDEPAFNPALTKTYITIKSIPEFRFTVENYNGITVRDVLSVMYDSLQRPMRRSDVSSLPPEAKDMAQMSFHTRTSMDPNEYVQGMKDLDRLCSKFHFVGLAPSPTSPGVWEVRFA